MDIVFRVSPCVCVVPTVVCHLTQDKREGTAMRRPQAFRLTCSPTESDNTTQDPGCTIREIAVTSDYIVAKHHEDTNHRVSRWIPNVSVPHPLLSLSHTSLFSLRSNPTSFSLSLVPTLTRSALAPPPPAGFKWTGGFALKMAGPFPV